MGNVDLSEWRVKLSRNVLHEDGSVFAWEATIYRGDDWRGTEYGKTRDEALEKARAAGERIKAGAPADEWVTLP